jgi:type I restriction enzyme M protein
VEADLVDCIVALPERLFLNTGIAVSLWFVSKDRHGNGRRARKGEVLFIDARKLGKMETRTLRVLNDEDVTRISQAYHMWRSKSTNPAYEDVPGFAKAASTSVIESHNYILTPGRYVGSTVIEEDTEPIEEKIVDCRRTCSQSLKKVVA